MTVNVNPGKFQVVILHKRKRNQTTKLQTLIREKVETFFVTSNCSYCSLVWNFSNAQSLSKIENLQKRTLRFLLNDYDNTYEDLPEKSGYPNMNVRRQRTLYIEIYMS